MKEYTFKVSTPEFRRMYNYMINELLQFTTSGTAYFDGDKEQFEEWAGDAFFDALYYCFKYLGIEDKFFIELT